MARQSVSQAAAVLAPFLSEEFARFADCMPERRRIAVRLAALMPHRSPDDPVIKLRHFFIEDHLTAAQSKAISEALSLDSPISGKLAGLRHFQHCSVCRAIIEADAANLIMERAKKDLRRQPNTGGGRKVPERITDQNRRYMRGDSRI